MTLKTSWVAAVVAVLLAAEASPARAQAGQMYGADEFFKVVWEPVEHGGRLSIGGYVANTYGVEATSVKLLVESLDAGGKVAARTIGHVNYPIPPSSRGFFEIFVPGEASSYRVSVFSWDWRRSPSGM
jgi:hypothetical protein